MAICYKVTLKRQSYPGGVRKLAYLKGKTVKSPTKLGIFLFKRKKDAKAYVDVSFNKRSCVPKFKKDFQILKVRTTERKRALKVCPNSTQNVDGFDTKKLFNISRSLNYARIEMAGEIQNVDDYGLWLCAPGTVVCPEIEVLT